MKTSKPTPTLQDVATLAGFSTATVSRSLNFPEQVTQKTRDKVNQAVNELGYSPNFGARVMAARRTKTIGAIIPTMDNAIFARGIQAFQEELHQHGYTMLVASSNYQRDLEEEQIRTLVARGADALLLIGHDRDPSLYDFLDVQAVPALVCWAFDPTETRVSVGFDNKAAMEILANHVIDYGHRQLGLITATLDGNDRTRRRLDGVRAAMAQHNIPHDTLTIIETTYGIESGASAFETLMTGPTPPTAILCANDVLAVGAIQMAYRMDLKVPQDISITGFDDMEIARLTNPALTTVHVPHQTMGRSAAKTLIAMLQGQEFEQSLQLGAEPILRGSLGRCTA